MATKLTAKSQLIGEKSCLLSIMTSPHRRWGPSGYHHLRCLLPQRPSHIILSTTCKPRNGSLRRAPLSGVKQPPDLSCTTAQAVAGDHFLPLYCFNGSIIMFHVLRNTTNIKAPSQYTDVISVELSSYLYSITHLMLDQKKNQ